MPLDAFLLVLRLLFIVLLYLFLMQVVVAIMRDTRKRVAGVTDVSTSAKGPVSLGQLVVVDSGPAGSKNGTFVNAQPAYNPVTAKAGDIIRVGFIQFKLVL